MKCGGTLVAGCLLAVYLLEAGPAYAVSDPKEMLPDPAQEARAEYIGSQLRIWRATCVPSCDSR